MFVNFQYYNNVLEVFGPAGSLATTAGVTTPSAPATTITPHELSVYRETLGFEKTILDGNASIGLRVPLIQTSQAISAVPTLPGATITDISSGLDGEQLGDISIVFKYLLYKDCCTGSVVSTGMVLTVPTGQEVIATNGGSDIDPVLIQPYVGWLCGKDNWYVQGFTSVVAPTDLRDVVELFNDFGVGYQIYRCSSDQMLTAITPTAELHINTPLTHRGLSAPYVYGVDAVDFTVGSHFDFGRTRLTLGVNSPVTGPEPYDVEAICQLNLRF